MDVCVVIVSNPLRWLVGSGCGRLSGVKRGISATAAALEHEAGADREGRETDTDTQEPPRSRRKTNQLTQFLRLRGSALVDEYRALEAAPGYSSSPYSRVATQSKPYLACAAKFERNEQLNDLLSIDIQISK